MSALLDAVRRFIAEGLQVVPLRDGHACVEKGWPERTFTIEDFGTDVRGVGVKSTPQRRIIDNDFDKLGPACLRLLPPTRVDGRPGKAPGHFEYVITGQLDPGQYDNVDGKVLIEILGTQAAMPPSPTKAGPRFFLHDVPVTTQSGEVLDRLVKLLATIGILVKHWPGGGRHDLLNAIAGFLARVGVPADDALIALEEITRAAEGEVWKDCSPAVRDSYAKYAADAPITGAPTIADAMGSAVAAKLRSWWIDDIRAKVTDELNETYFVVSLGKDDYIGDDSGDKVEFKTERSLNLRFANQRVNVGSAEEPRIETKYQVWKQHPHRREYRNVIFAPPPMPADPRDYNLWRGFPVRPLVPSDPAARANIETLRAWADAEAAPKCALFLELAHDVICAGDDEHYDWLLHLLAKGVQFPGEVGGVAVVMKGKRGVGKGRFVNYYGGIFGRHFTSISKREQILGKFNAAIADKVVVFADECFYAGDKASLGALKTLITEETLQLERKGIDPVEVPNCCHLFEATNEDWHTPAGFEERRFFALAVSDLWKQHPERFGALVQEQGNGGREALLSYLLTRDLTPERLLALRLPPRTPELDKQVGMSMPVEEQWWQERLMDGRITSGASDQDPWPERVTIERLHQDYLNYCDELKLHVRRVSKYHFKHQVLEQALSAHEREGRGSREWTWRLVRLAKARELFDAKKGIASEWPPEPSEPMVAARPQQPALEDRPT